MRQIDFIKINKETFTKSLPSAVVALVMVGAFAYAFTEPAGAPPTSNVASPLNTSATGQSKAGGLILNTGGAATGLIVSSGNVGIGTAGPGYKLHVKGGNTTSLGVDNDGSQYTEIDILNNGTNKASIYWDNTNSFLSLNGIVTKSGNVGIGVTSPGYKLDVAGDINYTGTLRLNGTPVSLGGSQWTTSGSNIYYNSGNVSIGTTDATYRVNAVANSANWGFLFQNSAGTNDYIYMNHGTYGVHIRNDSAPAGNYLLDVYPSNGLRFQVLGNGNVVANGSVGIGTASPGSLLEIYRQSDDRTTLSTLLTLNSDGNAPYSGFGSKITWNSEIYTGGHAETGYIGVVMGASYTTEADMVFATRGSSSVSEKMRILGNGYVGVGVSPSYKMDVLGPINTKGTSATWSSGGIRIEKGDSTAYRWLYINSAAAELRFYNGANEPYIDGNGVWHDASDISLKKDIVDIKYGLNEIMKLQPRSYFMKASGDAQIGFIAQEVEKIIPEIVSGEEGKKGMSYGNLEALTIKGIQEQQKQIEELQAQIKELKNLICPSHPEAAVCKK